jgi:hypothetical protein
MDPKSFAKDPHFQDEPENLAASLDLSQYTKFKSSPQPAPRPVVSSTVPAGKTLSEVSEVELIEARAALHAAAAGGGKVVKLPEGIHYKLFRAITG